MQVSITTFFSCEDGPMLCFFLVSYLFWVLRLPHEGKIVTVDQMYFFSSRTLSGNVPYVGKTEVPYESMGASLFKDSYLMGTFTLPPSNITSINMISISTYHWIIPSLD